MRIRERTLRYRPVPGSVGGALAIRPPEEAAALFRPFLQHEASEVFTPALLDTKHRLIAVPTVARGSLDPAVVHPREVLKAALLANAAGILTAHNHPSGDPTPSPDDRVLFARLRQAAEIVGLTLLDHLIVGEGQYWSETLKGEGR